jgi:two-component system osmolarity sensor histidine kinase EnvZ
MAIYLLKRVNKMQQKRHASLLKRTIIVTIIMVLLTQLLTLFLFSTLILRPQIQRLANVIASNIVVYSDTIKQTPVENRPQLIAGLQNSKYLTIWTGRQPPDNSGPPPRFIERIFMKQLAAALAENQSEINWRTDKKRRLWIEINFNNTPYWISFKNVGLGPSGLAMSLLALSGLLAIGVGLALNLHLLKPINELKTATDNFALDANINNLELKGPSEIRALRQSFNNMIERIANTERERSIVLAGISHDLRTPLAKLRLAIEMMGAKDKDLLETAQRQISNIETTLSQFISFARGFEDEDIAEFNVKSVFEDIKVEYPNNGIVIPHLMGDIFINGRHFAFTRAITNLVENAIKYGKPPISLNAYKCDGKLYLEVKDCGTGISDEKIDIITLPFVRGDNARNNDNQDYTSTGLGLAIVKKIVSTHSGELRFENHKDGFKTVIILP